MDSKNAASFAKIFTLLDPDVFVDNHVSNGADYQHVMTLLTTQHNKLGGETGAFLHQVFEPALYRQMAETPITVYSLTRSDLVGPSIFFIRGAFTTTELRKELPNHILE